MDYNPPISADELKVEFDKLKEVFRGDNSSAKFDASTVMMVLILRYLSNNIQSIDVEPITTVLGSTLIGLLRPRIPKGSVIHQLQNAVTVLFSSSGEAKVRAFAFGLVQLSKR